MNNNIVVSCPKNVAYVMLLGFDIIQTTGRFLNWGGLKSV